MKTTNANPKMVATGYEIELIQSLVHRMQELYEFKQQLVVDNLREVSDLLQEAAIEIAEYEDHFRSDESDMLDAELGN